MSACSRLAALYCTVRVFFCRVPNYLPISACLSIVTKNGGRHTLIKAARKSPHPTARQRTVKVRDVGMSLCPRWCLIYTVSVEPRLDGDGLFCVRIALPICTARAAENIAVAPVRRSAAARGVFLSCRVFCLYKLFCMTALRPWRQIFAYCRLG